MFSWDQRICRAEQLAAASPAAAEILTFYKEITSFQKSVYEMVGSSADGQTAPGLLAAYFTPLLSLITRIAPAPLASAARTLRDNGRTLEELLHTSWQHAPAAGSAGNVEEIFFVRALLQPYMEALAKRAIAAWNHTGAVCPFCAERPQVAVLRPEGDGAKRSLLCALCSTEWEFRRIVCPNCGEEHKDHLPVYSAAEFPHIRLEACDTCRTYIKSVDLSKDGLAVPVVDDLASIALNVWAAENGYACLQVSLLGL
jgi:FdhE protein